MDVAEQILGGLGARTNAVLTQFMEDTAGLEGQDIVFLQGAYGFSPEPITADHFARRSPYGNPQVTERHLRECAGRGWLEALAMDQYQLTDRGREVVEGFFALADTTFGELKPLPDEDLGQIVGLLDRVVTQARAVPEPAEKWGLSVGARFERGPSAPLTVRVRRRILDLLYFRDDAHIAAWQPYDVSGQAWEAFSYVWRGDASVAAELAEQLPYRNYDEEAYATTLRDLVTRGWIVEEEGRYLATDKGKALRQQAEETTDRYFDAAWGALPDAELEQLKGLLGQLAQALKPPEESG